MLHIIGHVYAEYGVYEVNYSSIEEKGIPIEFKATKNINVFRFIKEIRAINDKPIQEFRRSAEIKSFLSKQWSDMFKNYLSLLRNNEENVSLQNSVSDMESLIKQMRIMLDAVGKKVIGDEDKTQYNSILKQQNEVEARRIYQAICNGITVVVSEFTDRKTNVRKLIEAIKSTGVDFKEKMSIDDHEMDDVTDVLAGSLIGNLNSRNFSFARISTTFINSIPEIVGALNVSEIEKLVIRRLSVMPAYRIVFQVEGNDDKDLSFDE